MAQIAVESAALKPTARLLLQLVTDPNQVEFTHGPEGSMFIVPDEVAEAFVLAVAAQEADDKPAKKKAK